MIHVLSLAFICAMPAPAQEPPAASEGIGPDAGPGPASPPDGVARPPDHAVMKVGTANDRAVPPNAPPPPGAFAGPLYAADQVWGGDRMSPVRRATYAEHGTFRGGAFMLDRLEYHARKDGGGYAWEGAAWYGGDYDRLWLKSEGEGSGPSVAAADMEALWGHALDPWFDLQTGVRHERRSRSHTTQFVVGLQGTAPYWIDVDVAAFLSTRGDLTARVEIDYDQRITSRLILQPRVEFGLAAQSVRATDTGAGLSSVTAGLRLRYEIAREFAPYLGVEYAHDFAEDPGAANDRGGSGAPVAGVRAWF